MLKKYRFIYKYILFLREFDIEAFSLPSAIQKFYANFPRAKIVSIEEVNI